MLIPPNRQRALHDHAGERCGVDIFSLLIEKIFHPREETLGLLRLYMKDILQWPYELLLKTTSDIASSLGKFGKGSQSKRYEHSFVLPSFTLLQPILYHRLDKSMNHDHLPIPWPSDERELL